MAPRAVSGRVRFDRFTLDAQDRQLRCDGAPVELAARYFDALALLVGEAGKLVSKDRFLAEVWRGVPVTDEALTQCVRSLRKALGDDAASPRFIETVPKHGYRFIAAVEAEAALAPAPASAPQARNPAYVWRERWLLSLGGAVGGGTAGTIGGLIYGFAAAAAPTGVGGASTFVVVVFLSGLVGLIGGAGVGFGLALEGYLTGRASAWIVAGGALGGMVVGGLFKLVGADAFTLLFGHGPAHVTGAGEGFALGAAIGLGAWLSRRWTDEARLRLSVAVAGLAGAAAGVLIGLRGGRLMGGSLDALAHAFPDSRLRLDAIATLFGEDRFGPTSLTVTSGLEGALFAACVVGAMILAERGRF